MRPQVEIDSKHDLHVIIAALPAAFNVHVLCGRIQSLIGHHTPV
jgi:hypothetical protein